MRDELFICQPCRPPRHSLHLPIKNNLHLFLALEFTTWKMNVLVSGSSRECDDSRQGYECVDEWTRFRDLSCYPHHFSRIKLDEIWFKSTLVNVSQWFFFKHVYFSPLRWFVVQDVIISTCSFEMFALLSCLTILGHYFYMIPLHGWYILHDEFIFMWFCKNNSIIFHMFWMIHLFVIMIYFHIIFTFSSDFYDFLYPIHLFSHFVYII